MSLIKYDTNLTLPPFGLHNTGAICYFNSMLQCFLSCTSVIHIFHTTPELQQRNELCIAVWQLIQHGINRTNDSRMSDIIWQAFRQQLRELNITTTIGDGMEDVHEGFVKFLEAFNSPELEELFSHVYKRITQCTCGAKKEQMGHREIFIKLGIEQFLEDKPVDALILQTKQDVVDDFKCYKCGDRTRHQTIERLVFTPEVLILLFVKYTFSETKNRAVYSRWAAEVPNRIVIPAIKTGDITYHIVAMSEHSGDLESGHYWAHALRKDKKITMHRLDDSTTQETPDIMSTITTYMAWYHVI